MSPNLSRGVLDLIAEILRELRPEEVFSIAPWSEGGILTVQVERGRARIRRAFSGTFLSQGHAAAIHIEVSNMFSALRYTRGPTRAKDSAYERDITKATTSEDLTLADIAWHARNTYGWDCDEVVASEPMPREDYYVATCSNGLKLRVYLRPNQHPRITNMDGYCA